MDLTGHTIGHLKILAKHPEKGHNSKWVCECLLCGSVTVKSRPNLRSKKGPRDCGCQRSAKISKAQLVHGDSKAKGHIGHEIYKKWMQMRNRCKDPNKPYLSRGIRVCEEWAEYGVFKSWALSSNFDPYLELDRIDNDRDYSPENCRWVTHKENCQNKRHPRSKPVMNELGEIFMCGQEAARAYGLHRNSPSNAAKTGYRCAGLKWYFLDQSKTLIDKTECVG